MESRTLLRDFQSHNQSRSVYTVENGLVSKSKKIRLLDFNIYTTATYQKGTEANLSLHPLVGVYSLIKKISFLNLQGQEIDSMTNCINNMALRLIHMENGSQLDVGNVLNSTRNGFINIDEKSIVASSDLNGINSLYIDLASMLNYLNTREYIAEGFTILVEWNPQSVWGAEYKDLTTGNVIPLFISSPTLAIDEALGVNPMEVDMKPVMFINMVNDQIKFNAQTGGDISTGDLFKDSRLNSYYNQFISNLYYLNNDINGPYTGLGFSLDQQETFELTIDGKKLLPLKGINTSARKLAYLNDFTGESTLVSGSHLKLQSPLNINQTGVKCETISYNATCSFGCVKLDRFIQNDMTLSYTRPTKTETVNVVILAEVLKMYDPKSGQLTYVKQ